MVRRVSLVEESFELWMLLVTWGKSPALLGLSFPVTNGMKNGFGKFGFISPWWRRKPQKKRSLEDEVNGGRVRNSRTACMVLQTRVSSSERRLKGTTPGLEI